MTGTRAEIQARVDLLAELRTAGLTVPEAAAWMDITLRAADHYSAVWNRQQRERAASVSAPLPAAPAPAVWHWSDRAACRGYGDLFFSPDGERQVEREIREAQAKSLCSACPVRTECLEYSQWRPERHGVFGGLNEDERANERRNARRRAVARGEDVAA